MNLWRNTRTEETGVVSFADYDESLDYWPVLVTYFGYGPTESEWFEAEEFFATHVPERMHS